MKFFPSFGSLMSLICGIALTLTTQLPAHPSSEQNRENALKECSKGLLMTYFPEDIIKKTLEKYHVPQEKWPEITKELTESEKHIITRVEQKATKLDPNPLKDPEQRKVALKIFQETLAEVFTEVMKKNGIADENEIKDMLSDIQQQKINKLSECLKKHRESKQNDSSKEKETEPLVDKDKHPSDQQAHHDDDEEGEEEEHHEQHKE